MIVHSLVIGILIMAVALGFFGKRKGVTPSAVNWTDTNSSATSASSNTQTISGITKDISLSIEAVTASGVIGHGSFDVKVNGVVAATGFYSFATNRGSAAVRVSAGDTVQFVYNGGVPGWDDAFTVYNQSDGNAVLDTFHVTLAGTPV